MKNKKKTNSGGEKVKDKRRRQGSGQQSKTSVREMNKSHLKIMLLKTQ